MKTQRLLVVDDNLSLIHMIREHAKNSGKMEVLYEAHDGEEGFRMIKNHANEIDLVLLDLIMPNKDGIYLLDKLKEEEINANIIVITSFNADAIIKKLSSYNIKYFLLKPFDLKDLEQRVLEATQTEDKKAMTTYDYDLKISVTKILHELGVPSHIKGYQYIREGILLLYNNTNGFINNPPTENKNPVVKNIIYSYKLNILFNLYESFSTYTFPIAGTIPTEIDCANCFKPDVTNEYTLYIETTFKFINKDNIITSVLL